MSQYVDPYNQGKSKLMTSTNVNIVAEIGINANGSIELAKKMITAAKDAGFDYVKFQKRDINTVYSKVDLDKERQSPWGTTNREQKEGLEFSVGEYVEINRHCQEVGIQWTASPWDLTSLDFLISSGVPYIKIPSACLTDCAILQQAARSGIPVHLSTGMSDMYMIKTAVDVMLDAGYAPEVIYHSVSTYPSEIGELNLACIQTLKDEFGGYGTVIGYSGHERGIMPSVMAAILGARWIERHITMDRAAYGSDQAASLEPAGFKRLVRDIRDADVALGYPKKRILDTEVPIAAKLRRINDLYVKEVS